MTTTAAGQPRRFIDLPPITFSSRLEVAERRALFNSTLSIRCFCPSTSSLLIALDA